MYLGSNIRLVRKKWDFTQEGFGEFVGDYTRGMISTYEGARSKPDVFFMLRLQDLTNISIYDFVNKKLTDKDVPTSPLKENVYKQKSKGLGEDIVSQEDAQVVENNSRLMMDLLKRVELIERQLKRNKDSG
jgi:transcriptional regulator with XRE-family HTH domain